MSEQLCSLEFKLSKTIYYQRERERERLKKKKKKKKKRKIMGIMKQSHFTIPSRMYHHKKYLYFVFMYREKNSLTRSEKMLKTEIHLHFSPAPDSLTLLLLNISIVLLFIRENMKEGKNIL